LHDRLSAADFLAVLFPSEDLIEFLPPHKGVADLLSPESREMELLAKLDGRIKFELEGRFAAPPNVVRSPARPRSPPSAYPTRTRSPSRSRDPQIAHASRVEPRCFTAFKPFGALVGARGPAAAEGSPAEEGRPGRGQQRESPEVGDGRADRRAGLLGYRDSLGV
jgi:hypothetical protein